MPEPLGRITTYSNVIAARYNPNEFVGRKWLIEEITRFRDDEERRHMVIVGEPGSGKSTLLAYLAEAWNCPRHFIRVGSIDGVTGVDPRHFLLSLGAQLRQKYGRQIFEQAQEGSTSVLVGLASNKADIVGRLIHRFYTLPFLDEPHRDVRVSAGVVTGKSHVVGEEIKELINSAELLDETTLLHIALINPLRKIEEFFPTEKVVILIDALDEAFHHTGVRIPDILPRATDAEFPANLRLIMTSRPMTSRPGEVTNTFRSDDLLYLDDKKKGYWQANQQDIQSYIEKRLAEAPFAGLIAAWKREEVDDYVVQVLEHSQNNFLYLYYFFNELAASIRINRVDLRNFGIPKGLSEIYRSFAVEKIRKNVEDVIQFTVLGEIPLSLHPQLKAKPTISNVEVSGQKVMMTTTDSDQVMFSLAGWLRDIGVQITTPRLQKAEQLGVWEEKYLPILGVMVVAYEPLHREQIAGFAGVEVVYVDSVLARLKQFLDEVVDERATAYRFYHTSFSQYLLDSQQNQDYPLDKQEYHYQIASYYRMGRATWDEVDWSEVKESYPFNYLVAHLEASGYTEELHHLLALETNQQDNTWYTAKIARDDIMGYEADIRRAWHATENAYLPTDTERTGKNISLQCRYALITSSLKSQTEFVVPLLHSLVKQGLWPLHRAMWHARQVPELGGRLEAMIEILPLVESKSEQMKWWREILADIQPVEKWNGNGFVDLLVRSVISFPDPKPEEIIRTVLALIPENHKTTVFIKLEPYLPERILVEGLGWIRLHGASVSELATLARRLPELQRRKIFEEIIKTTRNTVDALDISKDPYKLEDAPSALREDADKLEDTLAQLVPYFEGEQREALLRELLQAARTTHDPLWLARDIGKLSCYMSPELLQDAFDIARHHCHWEAGYKIQALAGLAEQFSGSEREAVLQEAVEVIKTFDRNQSSISKDVSLLAPQLSVPLLKEALKIMQSINEGTALLHGLSYLLASVPDSVREQVGRFSIEVLPKLKEEWGQVQWIEQLAPHWPESLATEALPLARGYKDPDSKVKALAALARSEMVQEAQRERIVEEALTEVEKIVKAYDKAESLAKLATVPCPSLNETIVQRVFNTLNELGDRGGQAPILVQLAPHLSKEIAWSLLHDLEARHDLRPFRIISKDSWRKGRKRTWLSIEYDGERREPTILRFSLKDDEEDEICLSLLARLAQLGDHISALARLTELGDHISTYEMRKYPGKVEMLEAIARYLPGAQCLEAFHTVLQNPTSPKYEPALAKLCIRIAELDDGEKVLNYVQEMKDPLWRAQALTGIAPYIKGEMQNQVMQEALTATLRLGGYNRHHLLASLSLQLAMAPLPYLYELWQATLVQLDIDHSSRWEIISDLYCLNPMLTALRGTEFPGELLQTVRDILRWWP